MDRFDRIYGLHRIFRSARRPVPRKTLEEKLECSRATVNRAIEDLRDLRDLRDLLWAPLRYDRERNGYYYDEKDGEHPYELPGLWFNTSGLYVLFADPKGLSRFGARERRKVALHREIRGLERRLHRDDPNLHLRACVLSVTPASGIDDGKHSARATGGRTACASWTISTAWNRRSGTRWNPRPASESSFQRDALPSSQEPAPQKIWKKMSCFQPIFRARECLEVRSHAENPVSGNVQVLCRRDIFYGAGSWPSFPRKRESIA